jgi:hypothetical protein
MMKRLLCLSVLAVLTLSSSVALAADTCTEIVATGHPDYPAIAFKDGDQIKGAAPALVEAIAKDIKVPVKSEYMGSWADAQAAVRNGKADMIFGVYYNDDRAKYLDYVQPAFVYDPVVVFVSKSRQGRLCDCRLLSRPCHRGRHGHRRQGRGPGACGSFGRNVRRLFEKIALCRAGAEVQRGHHPDDHRWALPQNARRCHGRVGRLALGFKPAEPQHPVKD